MPVETVSSNHGNKNHIIREESDYSFTEEQAYIVFCGHKHFTGPKTSYQNWKEVPDLCNNCIRRFREEHDKEVRI